MSAIITRAADVGAELAARLTAVTLALGAETDIGLRVFRGRRHIDETRIPCVVVIEGDDNPDQQSVRGDVHLTAEYDLLAYVECDPDNPNDAAHAAIRDMKQAVFITGGKPDHRWAGKVKSVEYRGREIGPRADGAAFVVAGIRLAVEFVENLAQ